LALVLALVLLVAGFKVLAQEGVRRKLNGRDVARVHGPVEAPRAVVRGDLLGLKKEKQVADNYFRNVAKISCTRADYSHKETSSKRWDKKQLTHRKKNLLLK